MRVLIVYESLYGTNRTIAHAIAAGIGADASITVVEAQSAPAAVDADVDLIVVGGPNHQANLPRAETRAEAVARSEGTLHPADRGLREWLETVRMSRRDQPAAVWDTRMASPRILDIIDRSAGTIAKGLKRAGARLVGKPQKFYSADGLGALVDGEEERARAWGAELASLMRRA
ncbi:MAG: flavodoxin [Anaerolineae bacterium]